MTTESSNVRRSSGVRTLLGAAVWSFGAGLLLALAALATDASSAVAVVLGAAASVLVFLGGAIAVETVAGILPRASLLVALVTFVAQGAAVLMVLAAVARSGLLDRAGQQWLAGSVVVVTLAWAIANVVLTTRRRIPLYDLSLPGAQAGER
jgi:ATP synthase protein I